MIQDDQSSEAPKLEPVDEEDENLVCFCHCVTRGQVRAAIRAGADTHEKIQDATLASTGCSGCTYDVLALLQEEMKKNSKPVKE